MAATHSTSDAPVADAPPANANTPELPASGDRPVPTVLPHTQSAKRSATVLVPTSTDNSKNRIKKRIIVCCDGTWQDGLTDKKNWQYTNILRISRAIEHDDERHAVPTPQIVFYQSGIGSEKNFYSEWVQGATGSSLGEKVQEAYGFIAQNYQTGDEIFLFGFSRGAYTARMVAMFIGAIGVLNRQEMGQFADIFMAYQKRGSTTDPKELEQINQTLSKWTEPDSPGKRRVPGADGFSIKCIGVFDTVGSVGLPEELTRRSQSMTTIFGFPDHTLGEHIERAYHALAINETRADFNCCKFEQSAAGRAKGQILKQCWFAGEHSDIGGGWEDHDLSDITLGWMTASVGDALALDLKYLVSRPDPVAPWGQLPPHNPNTGIFAISDQIQRTMPTKTDDITHETVHSSVLQQKSIPQALADNLNANPHLITALLPLEEEIKANWHVVPRSPNDKDPDTKPQFPESQPSLIHRVAEIIGHTIGPHHQAEGVKNSMNPQS